MGNLHFQPLIPSSLWLMLALVGTAAMIWYAARRPAGVPKGAWGLIVCLMSAAGLTVFVLLANPTWSHQIDPPGGKPVLTILVDGSGSMATPDALNSATRFDAAVQTVREVADKLSGDFEIHLYEFDKSVKTIDAAGLSATRPTGTSTDLAAAIASGASNDAAAGQAIILLSDGIPNAGGGATGVLAAARAAKSMVCPIYTRTLGGQTQSQDISLALHSSQDLAIIGQKIPLTATVAHHGVTSGRTVVTLLQDGKEIDHRDALLDPNSPSDVHFLISQDKVGVYPYELRVQPLPGQTSLADTSASYVLRVVDQAVRILVLEGKPYWDSKFFVRTLSTDPAVAIDAITRISDGRIMRRTISHPTTQGGPSDVTETWKIVPDAKEFLSSVDKLAGYQIVVLGRDVGPFLDDTAISNLQTWISQQEGSLVCYRGSPMDQRDPRLEKLLPVDWSTVAPSRSRMALTDQGHALNWVQNDSFRDDPLPRLPSLADQQSVQSPKPLAVVLATSTLADGTHSPAIVYHQYGGGRVLTIEGSGMWRWAFLPPQYQNQEQVYASLWQSMMRWLTSGGKLQPGQLYSLRAERIRFGTDEPATATLLVRESKGAPNLPSIELVRLQGDSSPGNSPAKRIFSPSPVGTEAGVYRVNFAALPEGRYQATIAGSKPEDPATRIIFDVRRYDQEEIDLQARPDLMQRVGSESGGGVLSASDPAADLQRQFQTSLAKTHPPQIESASAWDRWWVLLTALGLWTASWAVRRSEGLI